MISQLDITWQRGKTTVKRLLTRVSRPINGMAHSYTCRDDLRAFCA